MFVGSGISAVFKCYPELLIGPVKRAKYIKETPSFLLAVVMRNYGKKLNRGHHAIGKVTTLLNRQRHFHHVRPHKRTTLFNSAAPTSALTCASHFASAAAFSVVFFMLVISSSNPGFAAALMIENRLDDMRRTS